MNRRKKHVFFPALASLPLLFLLSCSKHPAASPPAASPPPPAVAVTPAVDTSTPKKASLAFAGAMVSGDTDKMRSLAVGTNGQVFAFYTALAEMVGAQRRFKMVLAAKFGDTVSLPPEIEAIGSMNPVPPDEASWTEKIDGDTATLVDATGHAGWKFKKWMETGRWISTPPMPPSRRVGARHGAAAGDVHGSQTSVRHGRGENCRWIIQRPQGCGG